MTQKVLKHKEYSGSVEFSLADGCLHGKIQFIEDIITYEGNTVPEIEQAFKDAVDDYLAYCQETGSPANKPFSGTFNIRTTPEAHKSAARAAFEAGVTLNEWVGTAIQRAIEAGVMKVEHHHTHEVNVRVKEDGGKFFQASSGEKITETGYAHH